LAPSDELPDPSLRAVVWTLRDGSKIVEAADTEDDAVLEIDDFFKGDEDREEDAEEEEEDAQGRAQAMENEEEDDVDDFVS
jgi:hypothetical protein